MKVSFFETGRYRAPRALPPEWPVPSGAYDHEAGAQAYQGIIERLEYVEALGFDWVSVSEHHYSPRILTPAPIVTAAYIAARLHKITIALLGPIVPYSNPVRVAEELAMLDNLAQGRLVVGLLRGTTNESLTYDLNPREARERTDEGMGKATRYYREQCARHGWTPAPEQILYRANMLVAATDDDAQASLRKQPNQAPFAMRAGVRDALMTLDSRNIAGEARAPIVSGALPTTFIGSPDTIIEQVRRCRDVVGAGVLDLSLHPPGSGDLDALMRSLDLFGKSVLPRIRDI